MNTPKYELFLLDNAGNRIGEIDDYIDFEIALKFNNVSNFLMTLPANQTTASQIVWSSAIEFYRNNSYLFTGLVDSFKRSKESRRNELVVSGPDEMIHLNDRVVYPSANGDFSTQAYDVYSGHMEGALKHYVNNNCGPGAIAARQILSVEPDLLRGSAIEKSGRFQYLLEFLQEIVLEGEAELGFRVRNRQFEVYEPDDLRGQVVFSEGLETLSSLDYELQAPSANCVICGASGEDASRIVDVLADDDSILAYGRRIEVFRDRRDTEEAAEIQQTMQEELAQNAERFSFSFTSVELEDVKPFDSWNLGDLVSAYADGKLIEQRIREISISVDRSNGEVIVPLIGTPGNSNLNYVSPLFAQMKKVRRRLNHLEVSI